jgi:hypothetical protein
MHRGGGGGMHVHPVHPPLVRPCLQYTCQHLDPSYFSLPTTGTFKGSWKRETMGVGKESNVR